MTGDESTPSVLAGLIRPCRQRQQLSAKVHAAGGSSGYMSCRLALESDAERDSRQVCSFVSESPRSEWL
jgi:hypothetical protein